MSKSTKVLPQKKKKSSAVRPVEANTTTTTTTTTATTTKNRNSPKSTSVNVGSSNTSSIDDVASRVAASIEHIFDRYDADCNGNIDSIELEALLKDVNHMAGGNESNLTQEVQEVLNAIGTQKENSDVDGLSINKDAFVEWTLTKLIKGYGGGLHNNSGENRKPKRKMSKALPLQLERFLSSMGKVSLQIAAASSTTPRLYRDFRRYLPSEMPSKPTYKKVNLKLVNSGLNKNLPVVEPKTTISPASTTVSEMEETKETKETQETKQERTTTGTTGTTETKEKSRPNTPAMSIYQAEARGTIKAACAMLHLQVGLRTLFEQFGHHDQKLDAGMEISDIADVFCKLPIFYEKVKTALKPKEIQQLEVSLPNICTVADVPNVFRALDGNGNGKIEMREFSDWFVAGSIRSAEQQMAFAARSPYNLRLTHLLRVVVIIAQNMISYAHVEYFNQHVYNLFISARPAAHNMSLTLKQLERMFAAVTERMEEGKKNQSVACIFTTKDAKTIFNALDTDGDGSINDHEFISWILRGTSLSYAERHLFVAESDVNMRIINFLEVVVVLCGGAELLDGMMLASQTAKVHHDRLEHGLKNLFSHFDADNSGEIDKEELERLMIDLPTRFYVSPETVCLPSDVDVVMKTLDADDSGAVDYEEWKSWILKHNKKSRNARDTFASQSDAHHRLDRFIDTIIHISHEVSATLCDKGHELRPGLKTLFQEFDRENNNFLQAEDIVSMIETLKLSHGELIWFECDKKQSMEIAVAIGGESGQITCERWVEWMIRGARRPALERAKFASHSTAFKRINIFLESVLIVVRKSNLLIDSINSKVAGYQRAAGRHTGGYGGNFGGQNTCIRRTSVTGTTTGNTGTGATGSSSSSSSSGAQITGSSEDQNDVLVV